LLGDGVAFGETVGDLLGVGVLGLEVGEGFFVLGVGDGLEVFVAPAASFIIPGNNVPRATKKTLREICPMKEIVAKQNLG
jgi:hypothetical protein